MNLEFCVGDGSPCNFTLRQAMKSSDKAWIFKSKQRKFEDDLSLYITENI